MSRVRLLALQSMERNWESEGYEVDADEGRALLDSQAREYFGISGDEFVRKWDAGEFEDEDACPEAVRVATLIPLVR